MGIKPRHCIRIFAALTITVTLTGAAQAAQLEFGEVRFDNLDGVDGLDGPTSVSVSPDGQHVYVASNNEDSLAVFSRNGSTGRLTFVEAQIDGVAGVNGLGGATSVSVSPDGLHVYVAGFDDDAVAVFSRNASTGAVTFVEAQIDGVTGVNGLDGAGGVSVSPDGQHVYAVGFVDDSIAVFSRNASSGALTFVEVQMDGIASVDGLDGVVSVLVSPDGQHVYAVGFIDNSIAVFSRNASTGRLFFVEAQIDGVLGVNGLDFARAVVVSPDGQHVYAVGQIDNSIAVFSRDASTGRLTFVEAQIDGNGNVNGLDGAFSVSVSPDGQHVYAAGFIDNSIAVFSRNASTGALTFVEAQIDGIASVNGLAGASGVSVSPDGQHVYAVGFNDDAVAFFSTAQFRFDEVQVDGVAMADGLDGAIDLVISPDGRHVYTAALIDDAVGVFGLDAQNSNLSFIEAEHNNQGGVVSMNGPAKLAMSGDGRDLYVAAPASSGLVHFSRDIGTGELEFSESLSSFSTGSGLAGANTVTVSPDGAHVYVGLVFENAVSAWSRNPTTGVLTFIEIQSELGGVVSGLNQVQDLWVSSDGLDLYAAASNNASAAGAHFFRNRTSGALTFQGEISGFGDGGSAVVVPPDGLFAYIGDRVGVLGYSRSQFTGVLTLDGTISTIDGGADDLAVSPDGRHLLGVDRDGDALFVRTRDAITGAVLLAQREFDGVAGVNGLDSAEAVAVTPFGGHALVTSSGDDSLALFVPEPEGTMGLGTGLIAIALLAMRRERRACDL